MANRNILIAALVVFGVGCLCDARSRLQTEVKSMRKALGDVLLDTIYFKKELADLWETMNKTINSNVDVTAMTSDVNNPPGEAVANISCMCGKSDDSENVAILKKRLDTFAFGMNIIQKGVRDEKAANREILQQVQTEKVLRESIQRSVSQIKEEMMNESLEMSAMIIPRSEIDANMTSFGREINNVAELVAKQAQQIGELSRDLDAKSTQMQNMKDENLTMKQMIKKMMGFVKILIHQKDWIPFRNSLYRQFKEGQNWHEAVRRCSSYNAHLAEIASVAENNFLTTTFEITDRTWLGGTDEDEESVWRWNDSGTPIGYVNWEDGEPNNYNRAEDCIMIGKSSKWNDLNCNVESHFICEIDISEMVL